MKKVIDREIAERIINLRHVISNDPTRPYLNAVHIKNGMALATDAHVLTWVKSADLDGIEGAIPLEALNTLKHEPVLVIDTDEGYVANHNESIKFKLDKFASRLEELVAGFIEYPETVATEKEGQVFDMRLSFNPTLLSRAAKSLGFHKHHGFVLRFKDHKTPINLYYKGVWSGVLMPMRI